MNSINNLIAITIIHKPKPLFFHKLSHFIKYLLMSLLNLLVPQQILLIQFIAIIDQFWFISVINLFSNFLNLFIQQGKVNLLAQNIFQDHLGLVEMEHGGYWSYVLFDIHVQVALLVYLDWIPILWELNWAVKHIHFFNL